MSPTPAWDDNAVCDLLVDLRESVRRYAAGFDASLLSGADASSVVDVAGAIERMAATVKSLAAARSAETGVWRSTGDRSAAHHLARSTGTSVGQAAESLDTARRLSDLPAVAHAARAASCRRRRRRP